MSSEIQTALELTGKIGSIIHDSKDSSLIEYTKPTRVEPIVLMDKRVMNTPYAADIVQSLCSVFTGYYLQAIALTVNVGNVNTLKLLDRLNPSRDLAGNFLGKAAEISNEAYKYSLARPGETVALEAASFGKDIGKLVQDAHNLSVGKMAASFGKDIGKLVQDAHNLSVGKMVEVEIESDGQKAKFPINVRMIVSGTDSDLLTHSLSVGKDNKGFKERFHAWRSGQLKFIRDLVFCQDLIDAHRNNLIKDKNNFYAETLKRRKKNKLSAILSGSPSIANSSNIYVISEKTRKDLEYELRGKLDSFKVREKLFHDTYGMILVVVDTEWEQVTMYHRSITEPTEFSVKEMKSINKGTGPDITEILRAYQMGSAPAV